MNSNKLVSIIVPIYNVEKYLEKCVCSILNQDYNNLEVILVNDGSTDKSLEICERLQKKDNRIKIINQKNLGVSAARNNGFYYSKGDYICFIDSDDIIEIDMVGGLKKQYNTIAIITKSSLEAKKLYIALKDKINLNLITSDNLNYNNDINILPSYLSKGLEFDCVILVDSEFDKNCIIDLKLFYVAMTRALHKLSIVKTIV